MALNTNYMLLAVAHTMRASFFACACRQSFDHPGAVVCGRLRVKTCALAWVVAGEKHYKANTTLKYLILSSNHVANEGATALAEAVKVADLTCGLELQVLGFDKCCFATMLSRAGVSELLYEGTRSTDHFA